MVPTLPHPRRRTTSGPADLPPAVASELCRLGWTAHRVEYDAGLDPDPRVEVVPREGVATVEVLLPARGPVPARWQAVRVDPDDRAVWSGPPGTCSASALLGFLEDLLLRPESELTTRYERLG